MRTRIVKGKITKITQGAHDLFAQEDIVYNSLSNNTEVGESKGISFNDPVAPPPSAEIISIRWLYEDDNPIGVERTINKVKFSDVIFGKKVKLEVEVKNTGSQRAVTIKIVNPNTLFSNTYIVTLNGNIARTGALLYHYHAIKAGIKGI